MHNYYHIRRTQNGSPHPVVHQIPIPPPAPCGILCGISAPSRLPRGSRTPVFEHDRGSLTRMIALAKQLCWRIRSNRTDMLDVGWPHNKLSGITSRDEGISRRSGRPSSFKAIAPSPNRNIINSSSSSSSSSVIIQSEHLHAECLLSLREWSLHGYSDFTFPILCVSCRAANKGKASA
ncbi:hypothetical protein CPC735_036300 [Coccidioides posadasii C735 delta SOWgp]|uniref:Uncharacterized protein n=1 Tax=Coccidioides posadasii (strain C735) TaxID=222929 RepID=C5P221_COCP7|nr:hypothetical protein CPC735_036300 [Coccidioides posadasii C735 delta SOWgp]EER28924.1 hypothetical protein CPC735_036300 [Coccidioides posadasii C735 delta SOWgp]|eukprot:XP_003071069.1 hypothetical protein CPC735_036300 [Coccidioides posadasii C735 delta SOWgp]